MQLGSYLAVSCWTGNASYVGSLISPPSFFFSASAHLHASLGLSFSPFAEEMITTCDAAGEFGRCAPEKSPACCKMQRIGLSHNVLDVSERAARAANAAPRGKQPRSAYEQRAFDRWDGSISCTVYLVLLQVTDWGLSGDGPASQLAQSSRGQSKVALGGEGGEAWSQSVQ